ncbi:Uncharacterised protein [Vibrio cholerae]|nr:Uncharacterised protein [Vibrio cholerae]CSI74548.1 Uncharacterised protein [Vibrio cholerae]
MMSRSVIGTLPSCISFGWTNWMSSISSILLSKTAHTKPSKSLRVTNRYLSDDMFFPLQSFEIPAH